MPPVDMTFDLDDAVALFADAGHWWAVGGGWAIDLHLGDLGRRPHKDVDVVCLAPEADGIREHLDEWDLHRIIDGDLHAWEAELAPAHQAWARPSPDADWAFELLFETIEDGLWRFRRNPEVTLPLERMRTIVRAVPTLDLGVSLIYKAKRDEDIDFDDLTEALPMMSPERRRWLSDAVAATHGSDHRWVAALNRE